MLKNDKGITLTALVFIIIMLWVIIAITVSTAIPLIDEARFEEEKTTLLLIQAKWKVEKEKVNFDGTSMFPETEIITQTEAEADNTKKKGHLKLKVDALPEGCIPEEGVTYYKLSQKCLDTMGLEDVIAGKGYIVNYANDDIILEKGIEYEGTIYYKLSDLSNLGV